MIYGQPVTFGGASGEIAITDNGTFDVKKYATANVNVAPVLLWTNASPTSSFAAQTLSFADSFDGYLIEMAVRPLQQSLGILYVPAGISGYHASPPRATSSGGSSDGTRQIDTTTNSVKFGNNSKGTTVNDRTVPTRIWGVKFTL